MSILKSPSGTTVYQKDENPESSFRVFDLGQNLYLYGEIAYDKENLTTYCSRAVQIMFKNSELTEIEAKKVGEFVNEFFTHAFLYSLGEEQLTEVYKRAPDDDFKDFTYRPNQIMKTNFLKGDQLQKYDLDRINNVSEEQSKNFKVISVLEFLPDGSGGVYREFGGVCYKNIFLDYFEMNYGDKEKVLAALDVEDEAGEIDIEKILQEEETYSRKFIETGERVLRQRGMSSGFLEPELEVLYEGELLDRRIKGEGVQRVGNICVMAGRFQSSLVLEEGSLTLFASETKLIGKFEGGKLCDENGRIEFLNKESTVADYYEGNVVDSKPHGKGKVVFVPAYERVYEGDFVQGIMDGFGKTTFGSGDVVLGEMKNDLVDGEGQIVRANGDAYRGRVLQIGKNSFEFEIEGRVVRGEGSVEEGVFRLDLRRDVGGDGGIGGIGGQSGGSSGFDGVAKMVAFGGFWTRGLLASPPVGGSLALSGVQLSPVIFDMSLFRNSVLEIKKLCLANFLASQNPARRLRTPNFISPQFSLKIIGRSKLLTSRQALFNLFKKLR